MLILIFCSHWHICSISICITLKCTHRFVCSHNTSTYMFADSYFPTVNLFIHRGTCLPLCIAFTHSFSYTYYILSSYRLIHNHFSVRVIIFFNSCIFPVFFKRFQVRFLLMNEYREARRPFHLAGIFQTYKAPSFGKGIPETDTTVFPFSLFSNL